MGILTGIGNFLGNFFGFGGGISNTMVMQRGRAMVHDMAMAEGEMLESREQLAMARLDNDAKTNVMAAVVGIRGTQYALDAKILGVNQEIARGYSKILGA